MDVQLVVFSELHETLIGFHRGSVVRVEIIMMALHGDGIDGGNQVMDGCHYVSYILCW